MANATPTKNSVIHEAALALARNGVRFTWMSVTDDLADLSPLPYAERHRAFEELCTRVSDLDRFERGDLHWSDVIPDAEGVERDEQAREALTTFVELALDRLTGGDA